MFPYFVQPAVGFSGDMNLVYGCKIEPGLPELAGYGICPISSADTFTRVIKTGV